MDKDIIIILLIIVIIFLLWKLSRSEQRPLNRATNSEVWEWVDYKGRLRRIEVTRRLDVR